MIYRYDSTSEIAKIDAKLWNKLWNKASEAKVCLVLINRGKNVPKQGRKAQLWK